MNLKSVWSMLEESYGVCDDIVSSAIVQRGGDIHLPPGWTTWVVAVLLFPAESISSARHMRIFPYGLARTMDERFASAAQNGYLLPDGDGYRPTETGKRIAHQVLQAATDSLAHVQPLPSSDLQRLVDYLIRLSDASFAAPEPPPKFCLTHYKNYKSTFSSDAPLPRLFIHYFKELDFYRMDSHMAAWRVYNLEGNRWEVFSEVWGEKNNTLDKLFEELSFRGITREEYASILQELVARGWIQQDGEKYEPTVEGKRIRDEAEALTDKYFFAAWSCLNESELEELASLAGQLRDGLKNLEGK